MESTWQEVWSLGKGRTRTYCTLAETEDGYAVDLFYGDTCIEASYFSTEDEAVAAAATLRFRYGSDERAGRMATAVTRETLRDLTAVMTGAAMPACSVRRR